MPTARRPTEAVEQSLLSRYLNAWERSDIKALVSTLREDASLVMPPMAQWFQGAQHIAAFLSLPFVVAPEADAERFRGVLTRSAGYPAIAMFRRAGPGAPWLPDSLHVLETDGDSVGRMVIYVTPALHAAHGITRVD